jgi:hypothetical protein
MILSILFVTIIPSKSHREVVLTTAEEIKYSCNRAWQRSRPTKNLFEVWKNSAIFDGRPIGGAVEALLTKFVNQQY